MIHKALAAMQGSRAAARLFGVAIHKATLSPNDPVERAFEEICNRFNLYLQRMFHRRGRNPDDRQRGLVIMDKSSYEETLQALATEFRVNGTRWGHLLNMAEVPLFVNSQASRLIQLADLVAFAVWRRYEYHDGRFLDPILPYFDAEGGVIHGLFHYRPREDVCYCPACMSREAKNTAL